VRRETELIEGRLGYLPGNKMKRSFIEYYQELTEEKASANTRASWLVALQHLRAFGGEFILFGTLTREFLESFRKHLLKKVTPNSAQIYFSRIKTALNQAVKEAVIPSNPAQYLSIKKEDRLPVYLTLEELRSLLRAPCANQHVRNAFVFSCFTGMRYSDVISLTWDRIAEGQVTFRQQKTGREERLPLAKQALEILEQQKITPRHDRTKRKVATDTIFFLPSQQVIDKQLKSWGEKAGLKKRISFHKARHTFATLSQSSGTDIYVISKLLGHKNLQSTQIYTRVTDGTKQQAVDSLPRL
ncbi:MAG: site-specific integrase, partial [Bacteroidota bacterium]